MTSHADMLKGLLAKKKGTQANRDAVKQAHKAAQEFKKNFKASQQNVAPSSAIMKSAQRGG